MAAYGRRFLVTGALVGVLSGVSAQAHPHVWIAMQSAIVFSEDGLINGLKVTWTFDDNYAQYALDGLDVDGDGNFSAAELDPLTKENIRSMKDYEFFTVMRANGEQQQVGEVTEFSQTWANAKLALHFQVPLEKPIDPKANEFVVKVYDPEFYIALDYVKEEPVNVVGRIPEQCKLVVKPVPTDAELDQTRTMLSEKGIDWKPEVNEDFGALFAQAVSIDCNT